MGNSSRSEDEDEEVTTAAHILCFMHKSKLDSKSAEELRDLVAKHTSIDTESNLSNSVTTISFQATSATVEFRNKKKTKKQHTKQDAESGSNKKIKRTKSTSSVTTTTTGNIPQLEHLHGLIGRCSKPFSRVLTPSDVKDHYSRLIITPPNYKEFVMPLLTEEDSVDDGIQVTTYDESGNQYSMMLKYWSNKYYVLATKGWKQFCHDQNLVSNDRHQDVITLWMFRHLQTRNLCCAITKG